MRIPQSSIVSLLILSLLLAFPSSCAHKKDIPIPVNGVLDLREYPIDILMLNGEWAFHWQQFIDPETPAATKPNFYPTVPSYWSQYNENIPNITRYGYSTYSLKILFPEDYANTLSLQVPVFDAAFKLYINGKLAGQNGEPGTSGETTTPEYRPFIHDFTPDSTEMNIVIHVANFNHRRGGFWKTMYLGQEDKIHISNERIKILSYTLLGLLLGAFLLFFVLFMLDKNKKTFLYFSLAIAGMLLRLMNTDFFAGPTLVPLPWEWVVRLEYLGTYLLCIFTICYFNSIFPRKSMKTFVKVTTTFFSVLIIFPLFFKIQIYSWSIYLIEVIGIFVLLNYTIYSFRLMLKGHRMETIFFLSITIMLFALINDILIANSIGVISRDYLLPLSFFFLIISNSILLIIDWISSFREKSAMHAELLQINKNLESIIQKRTEDLSNTNKELTANLDFKNRMFAIIAHDLKSPVSTLAQYADLLYKKNKMADENLLYANLRQLSFSAVDLINNLLTWGNKQGAEMQYKPDTCNIYRECEDIYKLFTQQFEQKYVKLIIDIPETLSAFCDPALLKIVLRNLVSNALKFTKANGRVRISGDQKDNLTTLVIQDNGIGMTQEKIEEIMHSNTSSTKGTDGEKGTGLGFIVIKDLIELNKGTISIKSNPGRGTIISFTLPGNHEIKTWL